MTNKMPNQTLAEAKPDTPVQLSSLGSFGASTAPRLRKTSEAVTHKTLKASWNHGLSRNFFTAWIIPEGANGAARSDRSVPVQKRAQMFSPADSVCVRCALRKCRLVGVRARGAISDR